MLRVPFLSCLIRALMITSVIFLVPHILGYRTCTAYLTSFLLFLTIDPFLFGQVFLWSSGFYNYIPPIWATLVILLLVFHFPKLHSCTAKISFCFTIFFLGICSQLFVEHSSIVNLILAFSCFFASIFRKERAMLLPSAVWLLSTIIGIGIMFSVPVIFYVEGNRSENYRAYNTSSLIAIAISCAKNVLKISSRFTGLNAIPICLGTLSTLVLTQGNRTEKTNYFVISSSLICSMLLIFYGLASTNIWCNELGIPVNLAIFVTVAVLFRTWFFSVFSIPSVPVRTSLLCLLLLTIMSLAPLLVVSPVPIRTTFQAYVFLIAADLVCLYELKKQLPFPLLKYGSSVLFFAVASISISLMLTFSCVKDMVHTREQYLRQELMNNADEILVYSIPYEYIGSWDSVWSFSNYFYRSEPHDTKITEIGFSQWMNDVYSSK